MPIPLSEIFFPQLSVLDEGLDEAGKKRPVKLSGIFQKANVKNANGRVYPKEVLAREVARLQSDIAERRVFMEADHPEGDSPPSTTRVTGILTKLEMRGDEVWGEEEVVETGSGKDIAAIARAGGKIGVSSRGRGTVKRENLAGLGECDVVQEDFQLATFDHVVGPSVRVAEITQMKEQQEATTMKDMTLAKLKAEHAEVYTALRTEAASEMAADFEKKVLEKANSPEITDKLIKAVFEKVVAELKAGEAEVQETDTAPEKDEQSETVEAMKTQIAALEAALKSTEIEKHIEAKLANDSDRALLVERVKAAKPQSAQEVDLLIASDKKLLAEARKSFGTPAGLGRPMVEGFDPENPGGRSKVTPLDRFTSMTRRIAGLPPSNQ